MMRARKSAIDWLALLNADASGFERALLDAAPQAAVTLDDVVKQLADDEQVKVLRYWQRSRWVPTGQSDAVNEMRRVFGTGPRWRQEEERKPSKLPPLYPPA